MEHSESVESEHTTVTHYSTADDTFDIRGVPATLKPDLQDTTEISNSETTPSLNVMTDKSTMSTETIVTETDVTEASMPKEAEVTNANEESEESIESSSMTSELMSGGNKMNSALTLNAQSAVWLLSLFYIFCMIVLS